ncbi:MAG: DUF4097 family beta strand repeat-containing protein [Bryobacterales bacterium]|nr:DUF4097 family beta strand repeat-containing protein [Bryobacterales bacterium]
MRPRSITGPIILIAIGALFLLHNLWPDIAMFDIFLRYWPYLLILWGAVRLVEVLFWAGTRRPLPPAGVSGGEWTVVVLLCVFGTLLFWGSKWAPSWNNGIRVRGLEIFGERYEFPVSAERQVGKNARIVLDLGRGNAKILGADDDKITVRGQKSINSYDQKDAGKADQQTPLEIVTVGDQIVIRTNQDKLDGSRRMSNDLDISIPKSASFEGRGRYGDFDVRDLGGSVQVNSDNAGVRLENIGGAVKVDLRRGDIVRATKIKGPVDVKLSTRGRAGEDLELDTIEGPVTVSGAFSGELNFRNLAKPLRFEGVTTDLRVEKTPGFIKMALGNLTAENVQGPFHLTAGTRDVNVRDFTGNVEIQVDRGDLELRPARQQVGRIDARTRNGEVDLVLPPGAKFDLNASTARGEISNEYGAPLKMETVGKGASLRGSTGGPAVTVTTDRGSITVRRAGAGEPPAPPVPPSGILPRKLPPPPVPEPQQQ